MATRAAHLIPIKLPHACLGSLTVVKPAPFSWHIWPNSWMAKEVDGWGRQQNVGGHPQPPHLLVYHHLEHLGLHRMGQPLEATFNALTFQHSSWLHAEEGDGPVWEPRRPTEGPFVW